MKRVIDFFELLSLGFTAVGELVTNARRDVFIESDEKNFRRLLKTKEDHAKFQRAMNDAITKGEPQPVNLNGKDVVISI